MKHFKWEAKARNPFRLSLSFLATSLYQSPQKVSQWCNALEGLTVEKPHRSAAQFLVFLVEREFSHT